LHGVRGAPPVAIDEFCSMAATFSAMVYALKDELSEIDINPVIISEHGSVAVDALITGSTCDE
jgi:hypothetical protein